MRKPKLIDKNKQTNKQKTSSELKRVVSDRAGILHSFCLIPKPVISLLHCNSKLKKEKKA